MKKLGFIGAILSALLLSACGSSSDNNAMSDKLGILMYENIAPGLCESDDLSNTIYNDGYRDFITQETSNRTTCATYGKSIGDYCQQFPVNTGNVNCVIGFNNFVGVNSTDDIAIYEISEILESIFQ